MVTDLLNGRKPNKLVDAGMVFLVFMCILVLIPIGIFIQITDRVISIRSTTTTYRVILIGLIIIAFLFVAQPRCKLVDPPPTPAPTPTFGIPKVGGN